MKHFLLLLLFTSIINFCFSQPGSLHPSFGDSGKVITGFPRTNIDCYASTIQSDNKTVVAGSYDSTWKEGYINGFLVMRYLPNGKLDKSFGNKGKVIINFGYDLQVAYAVAIQQDGKIIVTGYGVSGFFDVNYDIPIARLNIDGSLDSSFGNNGKVIADFSDGDIALSISIQNDNNIIISGRYSNVKFLLIRYKPNGSLDSSFGDNGKIIDSRIQSITSAATTLIQPDGKIVAGGIKDGSTIVWALTRYNIDGSPDLSFANGNFVYTNCSEYGARLTKIVLQKDGKIIGIGETGLFTSYHKEKNTVAIRYKSNGTLDNSYGVSGISILKFKEISSAGQSAVLQEDGKLIIAGKISLHNGSTDYLLARLKINGSLDSSFGVNGKVSTDFGLADVPWGVGIRSDGIIVAAGNSQWYKKGSIFDVSLAAYNQSGKKHIETAIVSGKLLNIVVYPNPAKNMLHIKGLSLNKKTELIIVDFKGNIRMQTAANNKSYDLNIGFLEPGNYLLKISEGNETVTRSFIKE